MGLPYLYTQPTDDASWRRWSFNHAANHYDLIAAAQSQKNATLQQFILDPMDPDDLGMWQYNHQISHSQLNAVLGTQGFDLLSLDWQNPAEFEEWLRLNGDEHTRLSAALGVG